MKAVLCVAALLASLPAAAQVTPPPVRSTVAIRAPVVPRTILFIGNSFTQGAHSAVRNYRADTVTDLNRAGYGGVPALFKRFTEQAGLSYAVSLETQGGKTLGFHLAERRALIDRAWDVVVLQDLSTFSRERPGDPATHIRDAGALAAIMRRANPRASVEILSTWSRADQVYRPGSPWTGTPIARMAQDLEKGSAAARVASRDITGIIPAGRAWNLAFATGVADPNPYDGVAYGQLNLWAYDHYHASVAGYYLEALVVFGKITGIDPRTLGPGEICADELGLSDEQAVALQKVAADALA